MTTHLYTPRLHLRLVTMADLPFVHNLNSLPETDEYNTLGIPANINETRHIIEAWIRDYKASPLQAYTFVIEDGNTKEFIGMLGMRMGKTAYKMAEIWYKLHLSHWNKGYATEAVKRIIEFGFVDLMLHRIEAGCATANLGSVKVLEKAGMKREGMRRKALPLKTGWADNYIYGILYDE